MSTKRTWQPKVRKRVKLGRSGQRLLECRPRDAQEATEKAGRLVGLPSASELVCDRPTVAQYLRRILDG